MNEEMNLKLYKSKASQFDLMKKAFLRFVISIPRTVLEEWLVEGKILKRDYTTNEITMKTIKKKKNVKKT